MQQIVNVIGPTIFVVVLGYLLGRVSKASVSTLIDVHPERAAHLFARGLHGFRAQGPAAGVEGGAADASVIRMGGVSPSRGLRCGCWE